MSDCCDSRTSQFNQMLWSYRIIDVIEDDKSCCLCSAICLIERDVCLVSGSRTIENDMRLYCGLWYLSRNLVRVNGLTSGHVKQVVHVNPHLVKAVSHHYTHTSGVNRSSPFPRRRFGELLWETNKCHFLRYGYVVDWSHLNWSRAIEVVGE
jgi:hypothetical protein